MVSLALFLLVASPAVTAEALLPTARVTYRDVVGKVVDDSTGEALPGVSVSLLYETAVSDGKGEFRFEKIPLTHTAQVSVRVKNSLGRIIGCMVIDVPTRYYPLAGSVGEKMGVRVVDPGADERVELRLAPLSADAVDSYCKKCHLSNPCVESSTFETVVHTGIDLRGTIVEEEEISLFSADLVRKGIQPDAYEKIRFQDTHPDGVNMESILKLPGYKAKYTIPTALLLREGKYVTCDTCHTRHMPTANKQYVVLPFDDEENTLCVSCHK